MTRQPNILLASLARVARASNPDDRAVAARDVMPAVLARGSATPDNLQAVERVEYLPDRGFVLVGSGESLSERLQTSTSPEPGEWLADLCGAADPSTVRETVAAARVVLAVASPGTSPELYDALVAMATGDGDPAPEVLARIRSSITARGEARAGITLPARFSFGPSVEGEWRSIGVIRGEAAGACSLGELVNSLDGDDSPEWCAAQRITVIVSGALGGRWYLGSAE